MAATFDYSKFLQDTGELERAHFLSAIQHNKARTAREAMQGLSSSLAGTLPYTSGKTKKGYIAGSLLSALAAAVMSKREERINEENNRRLALYIAKDRADKENKISGAYNIFKSDVEDERKYGLQKESLKQAGLKDLYRDKNQNALAIANIHKDAVIKSALAKAANKASAARGEKAESGVGLKDLQTASKRISNPNDMMEYLKSGGNLPLEEITEPSKWLGIPIGKKGTGRFKIARSNLIKGSRLKSILKGESKKNSGFSSYARIAKREDPNLSSREIEKMYNDYVTQGM